MWPKGLTLTLRPKVVWHPHPAPRPPPVARRPLQLRFLRFFCAIFSEGRPHRGRARALARPCRWRFGRPPAPSQYPDARPVGRPGDRGSAPFVVHRWNMSNQNTWDSDLFYPARAPLRARPAPLSAVRRAVWLPTRPESASESAVGGMPGLSRGRPVCGARGEIYVDSHSFVVCFSASAVASASPIQNRGKCSLQCSYCAQSRLWARVCVAAVIGSFELSLKTHQ